MIYVVLKLEPAISYNTTIKIFDTYQISKNYILAEVKKYLIFEFYDNKSEIFIEKNMKLYEDFLETYKILYYYGEFKNYYDCLDNFKIKFSIEEHEIIKT